MSMTKKQLHQLGGALSQLDKGITYLYDKRHQGIARITTAKDARGNSYKVINPACTEVCSNTAEYIDTIDMYSGQLVYIKSAFDSLKALYDNELSKGINL